ncbi:MAG: DNA adenine methylase, partial [Candidatus Nitrosopumilus limneticus]|nr:DNA adenine methylase [Candidatus Nitrosopumilus limneticus]
MKKTKIKKIIDPRQALKTPLRYPGGKSRACDKMDPYFPDLRDYKEFREPFVGGGSVAIYITKKYPNLNVWVNDLYEPLVNFWQQLQMFGIDLKNNLSDLKLKNYLHYDAKRLFILSKKKINDQSLSNLDRAAAFYIVNKCSFSGLTESSSFSPQASNSNFSMRGIEKLPDYSQLISKWRISNFSYDYMMDGNRNVFMYLDPPYDIKDNLYGNKGSMHKGFDHDKFAADCDNNDMDQLISYN